MEYETESRIKWYWVTISLIAISLSQFSFVFNEAGTSHTSVANNVRSTDLMQATLISYTGEIEFAPLADSLEEDRAKYIAAVKEMIKGRERKPADSVFKNIKLAKGTPAERILNMMDGFSKALGVSCGHCHNTKKFESEEKPQKDVARQMFVMNTKINNELLHAIKGLENLLPLINCTTCHRGQKKPAIQLPKK